MFSRAAFASAAIAASRVKQVGPRSVMFGSYLPVSDVSVPALLLPPALGSPSARQKRFRHEVHSSLQSLLVWSAAPGTMRTHEATLCATVPEATAKLSSRVLPTDWEDARYAFFAAAMLLGHKIPPSVTGQPAARWNYLKLVKAAAAGDLRPRTAGVAPGDCAPCSIRNGLREWGRFG